MTMHLEGPWLTTTGKIRSKRRKWASADAARKARELREEWEQRQREWAKLTPKFASKPVADPNMPRGAFKPLQYTPQYPPGREPQDIPSRDTGAGVAARPAEKVYTGTSVVGIVVQHKSCLQPVFSSEEAKDSAKMRR